MPRSKSSKLRGAWQDTKIEMLTWIQKTITMMEPGASAKDVESMVNACGKLIKMLGDISPDDQEQGVESKDLLKATERLRGAVRRATPGIQGLFGDDDEDDEDDDD